jgi:oxygen-independent coproporphyrinogen-3 oxidase
VNLSAAPRFTALPPLALYVHLPWCVRKCPYCDFNSHEARGEVPEQEYIAALTADLEQALPSIWGRKVCSVFIGGGTPSLFSARAVDVLLAAVRARLQLAGDAEITLEANPGTVEAEKFKGFRAAGVTRLSLGVQSFDAQQLAALGRIHGERAARGAVELALREFANVNIDLMYGLPGQSVAQTLTDMAAAIAYAPQHISAYHLTIEPNTYFHRHPPPLPDDDTTATMQDGIEEALAAAGYDHYEVSAYARRGEPSASPGGFPGAFYCRHNVNYWMFGDYLGIGAGAHSKLSFADRIVRQVRYRQPKQYMASVAADHPIQVEEPVDANDVGFEFMMNAMRLTDGFSANLFEERAGVPLTAVLPELDEAERRGFITRDHRRIAPTLLGRRFLNELLQLFLRKSATVQRSQAHGLQS